MFAIRFGCGLYTNGALSTDMLHFSAIWCRGGIIFHIFDSVLYTLAREYPNKFGIPPAYSYICMIFILSNPLC